MIGAFFLYATRVQRLASLAMSDQLPTVVQVNISPGGIPKTPIEVGRVVEAGIEGDGHNHEKHRTPKQALLMLDAEDIDDLKREGFDITWGSLGENLTVRNVSSDELQIGDRVRFSGGVAGEVTKYRKPCYVLDAIDPEMKVALKGRGGVYLRVIEPGEIRAGETIEILPADVPAESS